MGTSYNFILAQPTILVQRKKGFNVHYTIFGQCVGASWLVLAPLDRTVRVLVLAGGGGGILSRG